MRSSIGQLRTEAVSRRAGDDFRREYGRAHGGGRSAGAVHLQHRGAGELESGAHIQRFPVADLIQLPAALPVNQAAEVMVRRPEENNSDQVTVHAAAIQAVAPAMYFYRFTGETNRRAFMMQSDGTFNGPGAGGLGPGTFRPVRPGEEVTVFLNAAGPTDPPLEDGTLAPADPPALLVHPPSVYINDVPQQVRFAGAIPYTAGLFSVRFVVNPAIGQRPEGDHLWINVADTRSRAFS